MKFLSMKNLVVVLLLVGSGGVDAADPYSAEGLAERREKSFVGTRAGEERVVGGIKLCWCPPGRFWMGSPAEEAGHRADEAQVEVTLTKGFWMGKYEVTQGQWKRVMEKIPGETIAGAGHDYPVYWINYDEAQEFCRRLTTKARAAGELPAGWEFCLPTEAQWEYACRAGTTTAYAFGETLSKEQANFGRAYTGKPPFTEGSATKVGSYRPNAWGLCDMHGNEFEWCRDWYHARLPGGTDPDLSERRGAPNGDGSYSRVRRGGAWPETMEFCRSALRLRYEPERGADHIGMRVAVEEGK